MCRLGAAPFVAERGLLLCVTTTRVGTLPSSGSIRASATEKQTATDTGTEGRSGPPHHIHLSCSPRLSANTEMDTRHTMWSYSLGHATLSCTCEQCALQSPCITELVRADYFVHEVKHCTMVGRHVAILDVLTTRSGRCSHQSSKNRG